MEELEPIPNNSSRVGAYQVSTAVGETVRAYIPKPLPPYPPLNLESLSSLMEKANQALGRLDGLATLLPEVSLSLFLYYYIRKEAVLSSQIEGTQSSFSDLLLYESQEEPGVPLDDVQEVSNYVSALNYGLERLSGGFPLSLRLFKEIHAVLLQKGRGSDKTPGEFRRSQNWIGGTRPGNALFVPPPPEQMMEALGNLERFIHNEYGEYPTLIKAALAHVQFETVHPFLDGNGRLGRLLIILLLCEEQVLSAPLLYLSLYFKTNRQRYYELLQKVRLEGDWESWLFFFFEGVLETSNLAVNSAKRILAMFDEDRAKLVPPPGLSVYGRNQALSLMSLHDALKRKPIISISQAAELAGITFPTAKNGLEQLEKIGLAKEITGKKRGRIFIYQQYLHILQEGTEPISY